MAEKGVKPSCAERRIPSRVITTTQPYCDVGTKLKSVAVGISTVELQIEKGTSRISKTDKLPRLVFADGDYISDQTKERLKPFVEISWASSIEEENLISQLKEARIIVSDYAPITSRVINSAPGLRGIIVYGVGFDHIDVSAASKRGIPVTNLRGANSEDVAELAVCAMLALSRNLRMFEQYIRENKWRNLTDIPSSSWARGRRLNGKTIGIVGLGEIGKRVARICGKGFNTRILASDPIVTSQEASQLGVKLVALQTLLESSDFVTVHVPLNAQTEGMIGAKQIDAMKKSAYLINMSRGPILDEAALVRALREGKIAGAALDVFVTEPLPPTSPVLELGNTMLTPHIAGYTQEAIDDSEHMLVEETKRIVQGEIPRNIVNKLPH